MSLARAFTTRRAKVFGGGDADGKPARSHTVKTSLSGPIRSKISAPVELIHTTNPLSYDAPDIQREPKTATSTTSSFSLRSNGSSEHMSTGASSPLTSPDTPFPRYKDARQPPAAEPNHLSCYFTLPGQSSVPTPEVPAIPIRSPSHTKRSYEPLSRKTSASRPAESNYHEPLGRRPSASRLSEQSSRTVSSKASFSFSRSSSASTSTMASSHHSFGGQQPPKTSHMAPPPVPAALSTSAAAQYHKEPAASSDTSHPFGQELAQVTELAEEYAPATADKKRPAALKEDKELADLGLKKFTPEDYISEIQGLFATFFSETRHARAPAPQWI